MDFIDERKNEQRKKLQNYKQLELKHFSKLESKSNHYSLLIHSFHHSSLSYSNEYPLCPLNLVRLSRRDRLHSKKR